MGEPTHKTMTTREILSTWREEDGHVRQGTHPIPADGDIHDVDPIQDAADEARQALAQLDALLTAVEPLIGRGRYLDLDAAVMELVMAVRMECLSRTVLAARSMIDYPISVFVLPAADAAAGEEAGHAPA